MLRKTTALQKGDTIAVIAPASAPRYEQVFLEGLAALSGYGYTVEINRTSFEDKDGYLAANDNYRLSEINDFIRRDDIKAIFCVRGGYGTPRLLSGIDYEAAQKYPKLLIGYSDITALHWAMYQKAGWIGLSGPLITEMNRLSAQTWQMMWDMFEGNTPRFLQNPDGSALQTLKTGTATGTLIGGNLALIQALTGTPYFPDMKGKILFVEDVGEKPYQIDGMLCHLKNAGHLDALSGLVFGGFTEYDLPNPSKTMEEVLWEYSKALDIPVVSGLAYSHNPEKCTVPIGIEARLTATENHASIELLSSVVAGGKLV
jgi:muramoyltetrapeptide carboxypeptidase